MFKMDRKTIMKYVNNAKRGKEFATPNKTRRREYPIMVDGFDRGALQRLIYEFHRSSKHLGF